MLFRRAALLAWPFLLAVSSAPAQEPQQPRACNVSTITTGTTAVSAIVGPYNGYFIVNPLTAGDEAVAVEPLYVDPTTTATLVANATNTALALGAPFYGSRPGVGPVSVNATTSGHKFTCVRW